MTKQHFIALADALRASKPAEENDAAHVQWLADVGAIAIACKAANPRFNEIRWLGYTNGECGPSGGEIKKAA